VTDWIERIGLIVMTQADGAPAEAAVSAAETTLAADAVPTSVWDFVVKGGVMMIPIGLCSLVAMTVVAERLVSLRRRRVIPETFLPGLRKIMSKHPDEPRRAIEYCRRDGSPVSRVFAAGLRRLGGSLDVVERHIQEAGQREVLGLRKYLRVLSVIATVTPLLGLLGTILGMITAFQTVASSADALGRTEMLAGGIYEAMVTTAAGLVVAIPVLVCYHWLSARVQNTVMEIDHMTVDFVADLADGGAVIVENGAAAAVAAPPADTPPALDAVDVNVATT
jgi:biopolymer transport protein ExbB